MRVTHYMILIMAALTMSFAACKKNETSGGPGGIQDGRTTKVTLKIKQARGVATYAPGDANATDAEVTVNRIDVFIFDDGAPYGLVHRAFTLAADIYNTPGDLSAGLKDLELNDVKTGTKRIYVGINLSTTIVNRVVDSYSSLTDGISFNSQDLAGDELFDDIVGAMVTSNSNDASVAMFNTTDFDGTPDNVFDIVETPGPGDNEFTIEVSRLVAKVSVKINAASVLTLPGGTLSDLRFTAGQSNNRLRLAPLRNFVDGNWTFNTDWWNPDPPTDLNQNAVDVAYQLYTNTSVTTAWPDPALPGSAKIYLPENTSDDHRHGEVSFVSLRAIFTPSDDGEPLGFGSTPTVIGTFPAGTFYAVFTNDISPTGIGVHYFDQDADATAYQSVHGGAKLTYTDGFCYYRIYLNPAGDGSPGVGNEYDVLRNVFYKVNITKINAIGNTAPDDIPGASGTPAFPGDGVVTENPEVAADDIISPPVNADIVTTITIADWVINDTGDYEF